MDRVRAAFQATPRADFLPTAQRHRAGEDGPVEIGQGMTNSQPRTVEAMLRLLEVRPGHRVLDVGAGSGWSTALLAHLTGAGGSVVGTEIEPELVTFGAANLGRADRPWARIQAAPEGTLGDPRGAPYDRILVSAMARHLPAALVEQLAPGGVLVVPVQGTMVRVRSGPDGPSVTEHGAYRFVPLR